MVRPLRIQYPGAYYHVTCRGNGRRRIFLDPRDQEIFLEKLSLSLEIYNVSLLAYVCMQNHSHLLLTTPEGNLSEFMRHFNISYTSAFNRRHKRVGHLYQGRYKAFLIDADNYLLAVSRYIHLNPVRIRADSKKTDREIRGALLRYKWSSLPGYLSMKNKTEFIDYQTILDYMGGDNRKGREAYRRSVIREIGREEESPLAVGKGHGIVGDEKFIEWVKERFIRKAGAPREQPAIRELQIVCKPGELVEHFTQLSGISREEICRRGKRLVERAMLMELLYRLCSITQPEIGRLVGGIDYSAVSRARKRLRKRMRENPEVRNKFERLNDQLIQLSRGKT